MNKLKLLFLVFFLFVPSLLLAGGSEQKPITSVNVHLLGPEKIGNLMPVSVPVNNPQTSMKIHLGKQLYFDARLSASEKIACASCHDPVMGWSDEGPTSVGHEGKRGGRRAPPVSNSAYSPLQFWDGRAPTLEEQAKGPIENPVEMANTHTAMIRTLNDVPGYVEEFKKVFGTTPITIDQVAEAIAAFERTVVTTDSPFDRFVKGDRNALTAQEQRGLEIFNGKGHCTACHWGGYFSDGRFHNVGVTPADPQNPDEGRFKISNDIRDKGAFKTPTARDAALRAPYMHNGSEKTLEAVVEFYNRGGGKDPNLDPLIVPLGLSKEEVNALVAFLRRGLVSTNPEIADVKPIPADELPK